MAEGTPRDGVNPARVKGGTAAEKSAFASMKSMHHHHHHHQQQQHMGRPPQDPVYNKLAKSLQTPSKYQFGGGFGILHHGGSGGSPMIGGRAQTAVGGTHASGHSSLTHHHGGGGQHVERMPMQTMEVNRPFLYASPAGATNGGGQPAGADSLTDRR